MTTFDFTKALEGEQPLDGRFTVEVHTAKKKTSAKGTPMISLGVSDVESESAAWTNIVLMESTLWKAGPMLLALGLIDEDAPEFDYEGFDPDDIIGLELEADIVHQPEDGEYKARNEIAKLYPVD